MFGMLLDKGKAWATSPQAMKLMMNPKVQKAMMMAMQMPGTVREEVTCKTQKFASYADLVTRKDVQVLTKHLRKLEREVARLNRELENAKAAPPAPTPVTSAPVEAQAPTSENAPAKKKVKRKVVKKTAAAPTPEAPAAAEDAAKPKKKVKRKVVKKKAE